MNDWDEVRGRINLYDLIRNEVKGDIKKVGINVYNLSECPFCSGHDCFRIFNNTQSFNCFQCEAGGNAFNFVETYKNLSKYDSLKYLADYCNYPLQNSKPVSDLIAKKQSIFNAAGEYYHNKLIKSEKAHKWLSNHRGHSLKTIDLFKIGWTSNTKKGLYNHLKSTYTNKELLHSGLVRYSDNGYYDFFPNNVYIYPHFIHQKISHFTFKDPLKKLAYQLPNKYKLNGHLFYGQNAFYYDSVVLVEGENDRITTMRVTAEKNIAAIIGQISQEQMEFLKKYCRGKKIYCCFDNDASGIKYTNAIINELTGVAQVYILRIP